MQLNSDSTATDDTTAATPGMVQGAIDAAMNYTIGKATLDSTYLDIKSYSSVTYTKLGKIVSVCGYGIIFKEAIQSAGDIPVFATGLPAHASAFSDVTFIASTDSGEAATFCIPEGGSLNKWWSGVTTGEAYYFNVTYIAAE